MPLLFEQIQQNVSAKARFSLGSYRMRPLKHVKVVNNSGCVGMSEKWRGLESLRCNGWKPLPLWSPHCAKVTPLVSSPKSGKAFRHFGVFEVSAGY